MNKILYKEKVEESEVRKFELKPANFAKITSTDDSSYFFGLFLFLSGPPIAKKILIFLLKLN